MVAFHPYDFQARTLSGSRGPLRYLAFVLLPDQQIRLADLGPAEALDQAVGRFLLGVSRGPAGPSPVEAARALHRLALAPLVPSLAGRARVLLATEGQLSQVPFAALHDGRGYLVDRYRFTYLTSGRDLLRPTVAAAASGPPVVLADPDFAAAGGQAVVAYGGNTRALREGLGALPRLPGTRAEALRVRALLPDARLLLGSEASEANLLAIAAPPLLHIATHGVFLSNRDLARWQGSRALTVVAAPSAVPQPSSALVLAGALRSEKDAGDGAADGLATALELSGMNLWGTQLVVLSACETGRGDARIGQGVYGLRRAFFIAGAETVVTSLWKVADRETEALMARYYRGLLAGQGRAEALERAANEERARRPHPYYWAPFIALGRDEPLRAPLRPEVVDGRGASR